MRAIIILQTVGCSHTKEYMAFFIHETKAYKNKLSLA